MARKRAPPSRSSGYSPSPLSRVGCLNPVFSHTPSPGGPSPTSPSSAGASVPWARARPTACQRSYTGSGLPPPRSPQGRLAASLRIRTATGAAGGARPEPRYVSRTPACGKARAAPSSLGDAGHISAHPLASVYPSVYWGRDLKFQDARTPPPGLSPRCDWAGPTCTPAPAGTKNINVQS